MLWINNGSRDNCFTLLDGNFPLLQDISQFLFKPLKIKNTTWPQEDADPNNSRKIVYSYLKVVLPCPGKEKSSDSFFPCSCLSLARTLLHNVMQCLNEHTRKDYANWNYRNWLVWTYIRFSAALHCLKKWKIQRCIFLEFHTISSFTRQRAIFR